jgi:SHS2 domain-containing protein
VESQKNIFKNKFQFFEVTADVGFRAYGKTLAEAFQNAALAMFEVMTDTTNIKPIIERNIRIESEDQLALLYDWLSELLFLQDSEDLVFSQFKVKIVKRSPENYLIEASAWGEEFDPHLHPCRDEVKAVTFHLMEIQRKKEYRLQVILDI